MVTVLEGSNLWAALAASTGEPIVLPPGIVKVSTLCPPLVNLALIDLIGQNTTIQYIGKTPGILLSTQNLRTLRTDRVSFDGGGILTGILEQSAAPPSGAYTPTQWMLKRGGIANLAPGAIGYHVGGVNNCDGTLLEQFRFATGKGTTGFRSDNPNSLCHTFKHCGFAQQDESIVIQGGSFVSEGSQFSGSALNDIRIGPHSPIAIRGGWSQSSYKFLYIEYATVPCSVSIEDISISSYPADWIANNKGAQYAHTEQVQTFAQRGAIYCNRQAGLAMKNVRLAGTDGKPVYAVSARPLTEPIQWTKEQCLNSAGSAIWNQCGVTSG